MTTRLSSPLAELRDRYDVVIVGSGYGGAIAACRLARAGKSVCLLERGEERQPGEYPNHVTALVEQVQIDAPIGRVGSHTALFDVRYNNDITVVIGCGLGGTSQINAGICLRPEPSVFADSAWPADLQEAGALDPWFDTAEAMLRPSVAPEDYLKSGKTTALGLAATRLGAGLRPVPVLVNFETLPDGLNHVGVAQQPCVGCGDCVSGCNYAAKSTLIMNYLPDAKAHSASLFTRTRVSWVGKAADGWRVLGDVIGDGEANQPFAVSGAIVILAAGALGSTEILLRSRDQGLSLSDRLGAAFSGNGDTIGFAYDTDHVVHGVGLGGARPDPRSAPGPCSTAMVDLRAAGDPAAGMVMEDGAVPGALAGLLAPAFAAAAAVSGQSAPRSLGETLRRDGRAIESGLLGAEAGAVARTLFLLLMGHDDSGGRLYLENDRIRVTWPGLGSRANVESDSQTLRRASLALGGTYIPNPIWNTLTNHNMVTGHPLGGCAMGEDAGRGVVNHKSQVFTGAGDAVHAGLYVMDGSIVPSALGVNPLLTISALAERACHRLASDLR